METTEHIDVLVIGAGPAGLMAAEVLGSSGAQVVVAEAKPSVGRKFLMAGKSGLNLTKDEELEKFLAAYQESSEHLDPIVRMFGPGDVRNWAHALGVEVFTGTSGRVFPVAMKASPLLRSWLKRLEDFNVAFRMRWQWLGWDGDACVFNTPDGPRRLTATATILALGGASWSRLGSDGAWTRHLSSAGVALDRFEPSNVGLDVGWSHHMERFFGVPVKGTTLHADGQHHRGEFVISRRGLEGGGIYPVSRAARNGLPITIDLLPDWPVARLESVLQKPKGKLTLSNMLRRRTRLEPVKLALLREFAGNPLPVEDLPRLLKALPLLHDGPHPIDEAISVAGGVRWDAMDENLMLSARPGVFCSGEMISWEAPTGGYLLTACFATGRWAAQGAARWLEGRKS